MENFGVLTVTSPFFQTMIWAAADDDQQLASARIVFEFGQSGVADS
jgi:hypothetical protein